MRLKSVRFGNQPWIRAAAFYLRYQVFVEEQKIDPKLEFDALDASDRCYFVSFVADQPVATIRYQAFAEDPTAIQPDRFCVAQEFRNQGIGSDLLRRYEERARHAGFLRSILSAELSAQDFYLKAGYSSVGAPFEEDGILCVRMIKKLAKNN